MFSHLYFMSERNQSQKFCSNAGSGWHVIPFNQTAVFCRCENGRIAVDVPSFSWKARDCSNVVSPQERKIDGARGLCLNGAATSQKMVVILFIEARAKMFVPNATVRVLQMFYLTGRPKTVSRTSRQLQQLPKVLCKPRHIAKVGTSVTKRFHWLPTEYKSQCIPVNLDWDENKQ